MWKELIHISTIQVPGALLLDRRLTESAKLLWMVCQSSGQGQISRARLSDRAGLARHTIRRGLAQLEAAGWFQPAPPGQPCVTVPSDLLADTRLILRAKLIYAVLQLGPGVGEIGGQFTYPEIAQLTGAHPATVRTAIRSLWRIGWIKVQQKTKFGTLRFAYRNPVEERRQTEVVEAEQRLVEAQYTAEAIMREYLNLTVDSDQYQDGVFPGFLRNPLTEELMQFDRFYPPRVAFEFQGAQHDGPTKKFPDKVAAWKRKARDYIKQGICVERGITLVTVRDRDLSLKGMLEKVGNLLPLRNLEDHEPLVAFLENFSRVHRERARAAAKSKA